MNKIQFKQLIREAVIEAMDEFEKDKNPEEINELSMQDISSWVSKMGNAVKSFFSNDKTLAADWLQIAKNAVKPAALVLLIATLNSCASPEKLLRKYQDPQFQQEMKMKDPGYFKHIYATVKDSTGKEKVVIRKHLLHDPMFFGKQQGPESGTQNCLLGIGTCPTYKGTAEYPR
jgi:hypothetical protein